MRLARYLSQAGVAARRKAEVLIEEGRVRVNGKVVREVATNVDSDTDRVQVDGEGIQLEDLYYIVLNKPKGCVSTVSDPEGRQTVMDYLPRVPAAVKPVGRLDYHSEGVLLLTNDGELAAALLSPAKHVSKTYHVKVQGGLKDIHIEKLRRGVRLDDGQTTKPAQVDRLKAQSKHDWVVITIHEGKNRQIRRMLEALGLRAAKIQRVDFAGVGYHGLRVGDARELDAAELKMLREQVGLGPDPRSSTRGKWKAKREQTDRARRARAKERDEAMGVSSAEEKRAKKRTVPRPGGRSGARGRPERSESGRASERGTSASKRGAGARGTSGTARAKGPGTRAAGGARSESRGTTRAGKPGGRSGPAGGPGKPGGRSKPGGPGKPGGRSKPGGPGKPGARSKPGGSGKAPARANRAPKARTKKR